MSLSLPIISIEIEHLNNIKMSVAEITPSCGRVSHTCR